MNANLPKFAMVMTSDDSDLKRSARDVRQELAATAQEAVSTVPAFEAQAQATNKAAVAARGLAQATETSATLAQRNIASIGAAADAVKPSMDRLINSFAAITAPAANRDGRAADIAAYGRELDLIRAKHNPVYATLTAYQAKLAEIRKDYRAGAISADEMTAAITRHRQAALSTVAVLKGRAGSGADREGQFRRQNLMYQGMDIGQGLLGGMPIGMIAAQQLPQVAQNYIGQGGGMNGFLKDVGSVATSAARAITPLTVSIAGLAAGVALGAVAYNGYLASTKEVETAANGLGRAVAGTGASMEAAARAGASAAGISVSAARSMEAQFLRTGRIGSENFEALIAISKDFGATIGLDAAAAAGALADMFSDPAKAAETLYQQFGLIDAATARQATNLARSNRASEAQALLLDALPSRLVNASEATTALGRAWDFVGRMASNAGDAIGGAIDKAVSGPTLEDQLEEARKARESLSSPTGVLGNILNPAFLLKLPSLSAEDDISEQIRRRNAQQMREQQRASDIAQSRAVRAVSDSSGANAGSQRIETLRNDISTLESGRNLEGRDDVQIKRDEAALEAKKRVLDALVNSQQRALDLDRLDIQISSERNPILRAELEARRAVLELADQEVGAAAIATAEARARNRVIEETIAGSRNQAQDMQAEFDVRSRLNGLVAAGSISTADANRMLQEELTLRPLIAAAATAEGDTKERLNQVIADLRAGYAGLASQEKEASGRDYLRSQNERIEQLRVEQALIGASSETRERSMALLQAEQKIRSMGIDTNSSLAKQIRDQAQATAELNTQIEKQTEAWERVKSAAEGAIDGAIDKLSDGDFSGALDEVKNALKGFVADDIKANVKNALLGTSYGTAADLGGISGIAKRLFGGGNTDAASIVSGAMGQSVASMSVSAGTVMINGGVAGGLGGMLGGANDNSNVVPFTGGGDASIFRKAIKAIESDGSGGYSALGPVTKSGDRAYGAYQVMGANIPAWTKQTLGKSLTPDQFLGNSGAQDAVFDKIFGGYVSKYGQSGAAQAWFGGPGSVGKGGGSADILGTTGTAYVQKFNAALGTATQSTTVAAQGLGTLGSGFDQFGKSLTSVFPAAPAAGGGGGGLGGFFSSLFGGNRLASALSASPQFASAWGKGGIGLYDGGGYTGPGGVHEPRGIVHAGEVVWSQRDVARAGGPGTVDAMRLGRRGYAQGGVVSSGAYAVANNNNTHAPAPSSKIEFHDHVGVSIETQETTDDRGGRSQKFIISERLSDALTMPGGKARQTLGNQFGVKQRRTRR